MTSGESASVPRLGLALPSALVSGTIVNRDILRQDLRSRYLSHCMPHSAACDGIVQAGDG